METAGEMLSKIRGPHGERRFYPPFEHPATYRERLMLDRLKRIRQQLIGDEGIPLATRQLVDSLARFDEQIAYHADRVQAFEAAENEAKAQYVHAWLRGWNPPDPTR